MKLKRKLKKVKISNNLPKLINPLFFGLVFVGIGGMVAFYLQAAPGLCSTTNVIGTGTYNISVPETAQYKLWVRMQVPDTTNTNNTNGVRVELAGSTNQCMTVTTTSSSAVNQWQWVSTDAATSAQNITSSMTAGNYTAKILGMKARVKVDKVILLRSDDTCVPDGVRSGSRQPGDNCTTPDPTISISTASNSVQSGSGTTINWSSTNATSCTASNGWSGSKATSGSQSTGNLSATTNFTLHCTGAGGTTNKSVSVSVTAAPPPADTTAPTVTFSLPGFTITSGQSDVLVRSQKGVTWEPLASDASGIRSTVLTVNGQTVTGSQIPIGVNANGDYEVKAVVTDNAGLVTTKTLVVKVRYPDVNRSGAITIQDVSALVNRWGTANSMYDLSGNGVVDLPDLSYMLNRWGPIN